MAPSNARQFTSFDGCHQIASGTLASNVLAIKRATEAGASGPLLIFDEATGQVQDVDLRGSDAEMLTRLPPQLASAEGQPGAQEAPPQRGRGRPKLGVIAREVTLLPRHWDWLAAQPGGASVALRKLVEDARRRAAGSDSKRIAQERAYRFMSTMAGNLPGFEESTRALFADDREKLIALSAAWPADIRDFALRLASEEASA